MRHEDGTISKKKILISGAGIAGLLAYIYLDRNKYDVTLIEKGEQFRSVGYAITIWNCGYDILERTLLRQGPYAERFIKLEKTLMLGEETFPESLYSLRRLGYIVDREAFLDMLLVEARKVEGRMLLDTTIESAEIEDGKRLVTLSTGERSVYNLVVVCEGISSPTRDRYFKDVEIRESEYAVEYATIERIPALAGKNVIFRINNLTGVIMISPSSAMTAHFFLTTEPDYPARRAAMRNSLEAMLVQIYGRECKPVYREDTRVFKLKDVHVPDSYASGMILLGDAAHGRLPVLGVGTTLATEDAFSLSNLLNRLEGASWDEDIGGSLQAFSRTRRKRVKRLYALQDVVIKNSLPRPGAVKKEYGHLTKRVLLVFNIVSNRIFTIFFRRAVD